MHLDHEVITVAVAVLLSQIVVQTKFIITDLKKLSHVFFVPMIQFCWNGCCVVL